MRNRPYSREARDDFATNLVDLTGQIKASYHTESALQGLGIVSNAVSGSESFDSTNDWPRRASIGGAVDGSSSLLDRPHDLSMVLNCWGTRYRGVASMSLEPETRPEAEKLRFTCPKCGVGLRVPADRANRPGKCPKCNSSFVASAPAKMRTKAGRRLDTTNQYVPVVCRVCGTRMQAKLRQVGKTIRCPDCFSDNRVADKPVAKPSPKDPVADDSAPDEYQLRDEGAAGYSEPEELVPVVCRLCHTRMHAPISKIGRTIDCPDCNTPNQVLPPTRRAAAKQPSAMVGPSYGVGPRPKVTAQADHTHELMRDATTAFLEKERAKPKPPRRPFLSRVLSVLWQPRIAICYLMLTVATTFILALILTIPRLSAFMIPIVCAFTAIIASGTFITSAACYINITEKTAAGDDVIDRWPQFDVIDWLLESFYIVSSFTMCAAPAAVAQRFASGVPYVTEACIAAGFLLFPIVLLSMLDSNSSAIAYAPAVWGSLVRAPLGWIIFYVETSLLGGILVGACLIVPHQNMWVNAGLFLATHVSLALYSRLLGRLAWYVAHRAERVSTG